MKVNLCHWLNKHLSKIVAIRDNHCAACDITKAALCRQLVRLVLNTTILFKIAAFKKSGKFQKFPSVFLEK